MKKTIVTVLLVLALVVAMAVPVSAGTKKTSAFTLRSYFSNKIETVKISSSCIPYYNLQIGTDTVTPKTYKGYVYGSKTLQSTSGFAGLSWRFAKMGYVTGTVDGTSINFTDS